MNVVVLATSGSHTDIMVNFLDDAGIQPTAVLIEPSQSRRSLLYGRARRLGWHVVVGQILFIAIVLPLIRRGVEPRLKAIRQDYDLRVDPLIESRVTSITSVNAPATRELLRRLDPDAVVLSGTRIVKAETLDAVAAPVLNIHAGITPEYRGVHGGYWALWMGRPEEFGATLHLVDAGVDSGAVLAHVRPVPTAKDNFSTYPLLQLGAALPALVKTLTGLDQSKTLPDTVPTTGAGRQWFHPTLWQYLIGLRRGVR